MKINIPTNRRITVNVLMPFIIGLMVWAGCTGRAPWWTIILIFASHFELNLLIRK